MALVDHWPFFGLRVRTPRLELRTPDDELGGALGELAVLGVHDPATMPFSFPWTDAPPDELPRNCLVHYWTNRAQLTPASWHVALGVLVDGEVVGGTGLLATEFARLRTFETGSWLGQRFQGQGLGRELRHACLHLGFAGFGAEVATTAAWHDNAASLGVTRSLPYEPNGEDVRLRREQPDRMLHYRMPRAAWETIRRDDITLEGVEPCLPLLLGPTPPDSA